MSKLKELIKKKENISLAKFTSKTANYGRHYKLSPEKYSDEISERMLIALKKSLTQQGMAPMGGDKNP